MAFGMVDGFFSIIPTIVIFVIALVIGLVIAGFFKKAAQWNKNNNSPQIDVEAKIISKRNHSSFHYGTNEIHSHSTTQYFVAFEFSNGERLELEMGGNEFGVLVEGDKGMLRYQGTRFLEFKRVI